MSFTSQLFPFQRSNFYSFVPEALWCCSIQPIILFVKIMFNSFHLQLEWCPNYIILISSLSCFNRSGFQCLSCHVSSLFSSYSLLLLSNRVFFNFDHLRGIIPFKLFNFSRFFGFTRLSKRQLSFYLFFSSSIFPSGAILDLNQNFLREWQNFTS